MSWLPEGPLLGACTNAACSPPLKLYRTFSFIVIERLIGVLDLEVGEDVLLDNSSSIITEFALLKG